MYLGATEDWTVNNSLLVGDHTDLYCLCFSYEFEDGKLEPESALLQFLCRTTVLDPRFKADFIRSDQMMQSVENHLQQESQAQELENVTAGGAGK